MLAGAAEPAAERGLGSGKDASGGAGAEAFCDGMQGLGDADGGGLQPI